MCPAVLSACLAHNQQFRAVTGWSLQSPSPVPQHPGPAAPGVVSMALADGAPGLPVQAPDPRVTGRTLVSG